MAKIKTDYAVGGSGLTPTGGSTRHPPLVTVLRDIADDLEASLGADVVDWQTVAVAANTKDIDTPGYVLQIEATIATSAGPKIITQSTPVAGTVQVVYVSNKPTFNFFAADVVTEIAYIQIARPIGYTTRKTTKG